MEQPLASARVTRAPLVAHLKQVAKSRKMTEEQTKAFLNQHREDEEAPEDPPVELTWQLHVYFEFDRQRSGTGFGVNPISFQEIQAWCWLYKQQLAPWEVDLICSLDLVWREAFYARSRKTRPPDSESGGRSSESAPRPILTGGRTR